MSEKKSNVLIIEDSLAISTLIRDFLKKLGYADVVACNTGKAGIQIFTELVNAGKIPIILLDFHLPDMNAIEIMDSIFSIRPNAKIILETADASTNEQIKDAMRGGAYHYIQKPIRYENMKSVFDTLESEKQILEETPRENRSEKIRSFLKSASRISLTRLCEYSEIDVENIEKYLSDLEHEKKIMKIEDIREVACNQCNSVRIAHNFFCPSCNSTNFKQGKLIEHFKCGNVSIDESYKDDMCPKCHKEIKILGVDYKAIENYYICNGCGDKFPDPAQDYICVKCNNRFVLGKAKWISSAGYKTMNL